MSSGPCLLVVDDNAINLALMTYLLEASGFQTTAAENGEVALACLGSQRDVVAVLCDIQMPVMDGYEFARRVKAHLPWAGIPLVAVTALAMVGDRDRILAAGFDAYMAKPIEPLTFVARLFDAVPSLRAASARDDDTGRPPPAIILALDDKPFNLELKRGLLEPLGYKVLTVETPAVALQLARAHGPDLIISDVGMQHGSGFDFITLVKSDPALREIPFIFLTSTHWDAESRTRGLALGAKRYLSRPIDSMVLLAEIRACLAR